MGWFRRWMRSSVQEDGRAREWRRQWAAAAEHPEAASIGELRAGLEAIAAGAEDQDAFEIEREMLDGLESAVELAPQLAAGGPPVIATGHRAAGPDACHFSAPVSLPDDPAQPAGTLLLTSARLVFVGGARAVTIPWHSVAQCSHQDRDLLLVRVDRAEIQRIRCNSFGDTLRALLLVRHLAARRRV